MRPSSLPTTPRRVRPSVPVCFRLNPVLLLPNTCGARPSVLAHDPNAISCRSQLPSWWTAWRQRRRRSWRSCAACLPHLPPLAPRAPRRAATASWTGCACFLVYTVLLFPLSRACAATGHRRCCHLADRDPADHTAARSRGRCACMLFRAPLPNRCALAAVPLPPGALDQAVQRDAADWAGPHLHRLRPHVRKGAQSALMYGIASTCRAAAGVLCSVDAAAAGMRIAVAVPLVL